MGRYLNWFWRQRCILPVRWIMYPNWRKVATLSCGWPWPSCFVPGSPSSLQSAREMAKLSNFSSIWSNSIWKENGPWGWRSLSRKRNDWSGRRWWRERRSCCFCSRTSASTCTRPGSWTRGHRRSGSAGHRTRCTRRRLQQQQQQQNMITNSILLQCTKSPSVRPSVWRHLTRKRWQICNNLKRRPHPKIVLNRRERPSFSEIFSF